MTDICSKAYNCGGDFTAYKNLIMAKKKSFKDLIKNPETPVLVDFYADWCGPCQTLSPIVKDVGSELHGKVKVIKVNVDKNQGAAYAYGIRGVPTLILFHKGKILWRKAGLMTRRDLLSQIKKHINI
jgi:thioredoxin 1